MSYKISQKEILEGLLHQDTDVINYIYQEYGPIVKSYILKAGGNNEDARDIFQEGLTAVFINCRSGNYTLNRTTLFSTYLIQICKYKWFDVLKSAHRKRSSGIINDHISSNDDVMKDLIKDEKYRALHILIEQLGEQCKEILNRFYWIKENIEEISKQLNITPASVKNGKYRCMKKLKEMAISNNCFCH